MIGGLSWSRPAGGLNCGEAAASQWKLAGIQGEQEQERREIEMQWVVEERTKMRKMERIGNVHEQEQVGRRERAKERNYKQNTKRCKGTGGNQMNNYSRYWAGPSGKQTPPEAAPHFLFGCPSLSHWPLACHTGNYLLNTPGSNSVYAHSYLTANTLCLRGVSSLPTWLGHLGLYAHDYSACTQTQTQIQTPCQEA